LVLQHDGRDKAVFYNGLNGLESGGLVFTIRLQDTTTGAGYELIEVTDALQTEAEAILAALHQFTPALQPPQVTTISQANQYFITFDTCLDLDAGQQKPAGEITCDLQLKKVSGSQRVTLQPLNQAVFNFKDSFSAQPSIADCRELEALNTVKKTELGAAETYYCYQTSTGRYGWLALRGMTADGASLDWKTSSAAADLPRAGVAGTGEYDAGITVKDMTIPDGTVMQPGQTFTKTWQLLNKGTSTWTTGYALRFESGDRLGAAYEVALTSEVPPGGAVNVSVEMTAPLEPGEYTGHWVMRNASGRRFGMGEDGSKTFWVTIVVEE
ncbi:MAG: NBR1-Ig-like domain-containing protein, partial [Anaerolineaceae bacterium]